MGTPAIKTEVQIDATEIRICRPLASRIGQVTNKVESYICGKCPRRSILLQFALQALCYKTFVSKPRMSQFLGHNNTKLFHGLCKASQRPVNRSPCVKSMESPVNSCYRLDYRVSLSLTSFQ